MYVIITKLHLAVSLMRIYSIFI